MDPGPSSFKCVHHGCSKTFTRKDHLQRHAANHSTETFNCVKCHRPFKRLDLLQRHERRNICGDEAYQNSTPSKRRRTSEASDDQREPPLSTVSTHFPHPTTSTTTTSSSSITPQFNTIGPSVTNGNNIVSAPTFTPMGLDSGYVNNGDFISDFGFGLWAPEQWEALLHESLAPPFNEPIISSSTWDLTSQQPPRLQPQSAERGQQMIFQSIPQDYIVTEALLSRLRTNFPEFDVPLPFVIDSLTNYWTKTASTFPFIHRATFDINTAPDELTLMMVITGSFYINPKRDFSKMVQKIRGILVQECGLDMPITTLQAFTLCHVHDTWYGTEESQFVAQCMWPIMVAHSRKKGIGVLGKPDSEAQQEEAWTAWAKEEERRRSAYCVLLIDTQLSAFWNQHCSRQLSIFAHNLNLPCPRSQWEAATASEWMKIRQITPNTPTTKPKHSKSGYLPGLHPEFTVTVVAEGYSSAIMSALSEEHKFLFKVDLDNSLTTQMVLIGLIAIAWDCRTRGGMGIRFREGTKHWRSIVFNAVIQLRAAYESAVMHMSATVESRDMRDTFAICIISVLSDIPMLHVAAGAITFCGASIGPRQYSDAKRRLKLWAKTDDAWTCVWQSVRYLRQALFSEWGLYSSWAIFNTTLVLWGYTTSLSNSNSQNEHSIPPPHRTSPQLSFLFNNDNNNNNTNNNTQKEQEKQRIITSWLDKILNTQGKLDGIQNDQLRDLLEVVCEKLNKGQDLERDNGQLLSRLMSQRKSGKS
ncbi:uncharacterized protein IL334_005088 [Kwoniella shivajii]|uniref:C2H2-type domain-containing protein n=1 Tax=Kwoniella shivajii TaxID=564305 RepID=A0ABZ1D2S0_9TREE|nr:hypothetical protein IL334_005088 [Kwoniella shivajii]